MKLQRLLFLSISIFLSSYYQANSADDPHNICLETQDYIGCMKSFERQSNSPKDNCVEKYGKKQCSLNVFVESICKSNGDIKTHGSIAHKRLKEMGMQQKTMNELFIYDDEFEKDYRRLANQRCPRVFKKLFAQLGLDSTPKQKIKLDTNIFSQNDLGEKCPVGLGKGWCIAKRGKDILGMPKIVGWLYKEFPEDNRVFYEDLQPYKVNVRGSYGRYIHLKKVARYYENPKAGSPGYTIGGGTTTTNCYNYGGSISCTSSTDQGIRVPGSAGRPGGNKQLKFDYVIDCKDRTYETIQNNRGSKWKPLSEAKNVEMAANAFCKAGISSYPESSITKYSKRKKR